eukprot:scaffold125333_cov51-Phaeocystis_antarctica.AAC.1
MDRAAARIQGHVRHCSQNRFYAEEGQHQCDRMKGRVSYHSEPPKDPKNGLTAKGMYELQVWCSLQQLLRQLEPWFDGGCGGFRLGYSSTAGLRYSAPPDESGRRYTIRVFNITWDDRHERYEKREKDHDLLCCEEGLFHFRRSLPPACPRRGVTVRTALSSQLTPLRPASEPERSASGSGKRLLYLLYNAKFTYRMQMPDFTIYKISDGT